MAAQPEAALIGGEVGVYAFDNGQRSASGDYAPLFGTLGSAAAPAGGSTPDVLKYGESVDLDGADGFTMPSGFQTALADGSLTLWITFSVDDIGETQYLVDGSPTSSSDGGFSLWMQEGGRMWIQWRDDARTDMFAQVKDFEVAPCKAHTVMIIIDDTRARSRVYVDGALVRTTTNSLPDLSSNTPTALGSDRGGVHPWKGKIDALHLYDRPVPVIEHLAVLEGPYCESSCTDTYPPALRARLFGTIHTTGYYRSDVTLRIDAADAGVGLAGVWTDVADGENFTLGSGPFEFTEDGQYTVRYNASDNNSNQAGPDSVRFAIDREPPFASWVAPEPGHLYVVGSQVVKLPVDQTVIGGSTTFTFEVNGVDTTTEVATVVLYRDGFFIGVDTERPFTFEVPRPLPFPAVHEYEARVIDLAGNDLWLSQEIVWH